MRTIITILFCCLFSGNLLAQEWIEVVNNDRQIIEVNISSVKRDGNSMYVWTRTSYKNIKYYIDKKINILSRSGIKEDPKKWVNWSYTLAYQEINCKDSYSKIASLIDYNKDGTVIVRVDIPEKDREKYPISPNSLTYGLSSVVCIVYTYGVDGKKYSLMLDQVESFLEKYPNAKFIDAK